jgi:hypothetical protein
VLREHYALALLDRREVRPGSLLWGDRPHRVEDERPVVQPVVRGADLCADRRRLALDAAWKEVRIGVHLDVVDAEFAVDRGLREHRVGHGGEPSPRVDRVALQFHPDGGVGVVQLPRVDLLSQKRRAFADAAVELSPALARQGAVHQRDRLVHVTHLVMPWNIGAPGVRSESPAHGRENSRAQSMSI